MSISKNYFRYEYERKTCSGHGKINATLKGIKKNKNQKHNVKLQQGRYKLYSCPCKSNICIKNVPAVKPWGFRDLHITAMLSIKTEAILKPTCTLRMLRSLSLSRYYFSRES